MDSTVCDRGGPFDFFEDDPTLLVGDFDKHERLEPLLLDFLLVSMKGKRSFIRAEVGVPIGDCPGICELLGVVGHPSRQAVGVGTEAAGRLISSCFRSAGDFFDSCATVGSYSCTVWGQLTQDSEIDSFTDR